MDGNRSTFFVRRSPFSIRRSTLVARRWSFGVQRSAFVVAAALTVTLLSPCSTGAQPKPSAPLPELTAPVNDFGKVVDAENASAMDRMIRALQAATGDVVIVETVPTIEPYGDIREYAVKQFANSGKGIGQKGKNNGLLILLALKERRVWIEVGYGLEAWITDGYAGETSREYMIPEFPNGQYGAGLVNGTARITGRIAQARGATLTGFERPAEREPEIAPHIPISTI